MESIPNQSISYSLFSKNRTVSRILLFCLLCSVSFFYSCDDEPVLGDCEVQITNFSLASTSLDINGETSGSVRISESIGIDDLVLKSTVGIYLSSNSTYDSGDTALNAFAPGNVSNGVITYDQIDIPAGLSAGSYYLIAHIPAQNCGGGDFSEADSRAVAVTLN